MSLNDFLTMMIGAGGSAIVASWVLERIPWYSGMNDPEKKRWIFFGACCGISMTAFLVVTFVPATILLAISPYFFLVASVFSSVFLGSAFHTADKLAIGTKSNPIITIETTPGAVAKTLKDIDAK
jgi:hypothetical protein